MQESPPGEVDQGRRLLDLELPYVSFTQVELDSRLDCAHSSLREHRRRRVDPHYTPARCLGNRDRNAPGANCKLDQSPVSITGKPHVERDVSSEAREPVPVSVRPGVVEARHGNTNLRTNEAAFGGASHNWLGDPSTVLACIIVMTIWKEAGFFMIFYLAALQSISPELREAAGESDAAAMGALPELLEQEDLRGFLHCHTTYSDGTSSVAEWAEACRAAGYGYVGITDHSQAAAYAGGLRAEDIPRQRAEVDEVNRRYDDFRVLHGVEADILQDGSLDYSPDVRRGFDFVIASVHSRYGMDERQMTARVLKALDDPAVTILGHPTGRLLLSRDPYPIDLDAVFDRAAERGVAIEINADPQRLDLDWRAVRRAVERGVKISLGADAHGVAAIGNMELGVGVARKAWLAGAQVLNTEPVDAFLQFASRRRQTA